MINLPMNVGVHSLAIYFELRQGGEFIATTALKIHADADRSLILSSDKAIEDLVTASKADLEKMFADINEPMVSNDDGTLGPSGPIEIVPISVEEYHKREDEADKAEQERREKYFEEHGEYPEDSSSSDRMDHSGLDEDEV